MKKMREIGVSVLLFVLLTSFGFSQSRFQAGGYFAMGFPQNEFKENVDDISYGASGYFTYRLPNSPLSVGLSFSYLMYGHESREELLSSYVPEVWVDVNTTNAMILGHFLLRLQPPTGRLRPYLDGLIGFKLLTTDTRVRSQKFNDDEPIASSNHLRDTALSFGAGAGIMICAYAAPRRPNRGSPFAVYVDLGVRYLKGGNTEYMIEGSLIREGDEIIFEVYESTTDITSMHFGVSFSF